MDQHFVKAALLFLPLLLWRCGDGVPDSIDASGTIEGTNTTVSAEVSGRLLSARVDEGASVRIGDTLARINDEDYRLQCAQAEANAVAAEAQYRLAREGARSEDVRQAEAAYQNASADYKRMKDLLASQTVTQKQFDEADTRYVAAEQGYQKLVKGLRPAEIETARARHDQARAQVEQLQKKIRDCVVLSPANGTVTLRAFEPGEFLAIGAGIFRITKLDTVELTIYVNERDLGLVSLGQRAEVSIDTYPDRRFEGTVTFISPTAEFTPKNVQTKEERTKLVFAVKMRIPNAEGVLKPGMPADARLAVTPSSQTQTTP